MKPAITLDLSGRNPPPSPHLASWYAPGLSDGLGDRLLMFDNTATASLELLRFRADFSGAAHFEAAVRERLRELEHFDHPGIAPVRALKWLSEGDGLALISNHTVGRRLSEVLLAARGPALGFDLIRQLSPVLADLQLQGSNIAHGVLTPERIIVTPEGRLVVVEHVLGSALQSLGLPAHRLRSDLGLSSRGPHAMLDSRADVVQLGLAALSMVLGRRLDPDEYPLKVASLLDELELVDAPGAADFSRLRRWMQHALQLGGHSFGSAIEADAALREVLEQRDDTPRQNVIAFPAPEMPPVIELVSEPEPAAPVSDVRAATAARSRGDDRARTGAAVRGFADLHFDTESARAEFARRDRPRRRLVVPDASGEPTHLQSITGRLPTVPQLLAGVCVFQAVVIIGLLMTRPAPIVITRIEPAAPAAAAANAGEAGSVPATPARGQTAARAAVVPPPSPQGPGDLPTPPKVPTFSERVATTVKGTPAAIGRGIAWVWHSTADFVVGIFSRAGANAKR